MQIFWQNTKRISYYLIAPLLSIFLTIFYFYDLKIIDEESAGLLFAKYGDYIGIATVLKLFIKEGLTFCSKYVAYPQIDTTCFYDYALEHNFFHFLILRFLTFFSNNPYVLIFYAVLTTNALIGLTSNFCFRQFKIGKINAILLSILFTFTPHRIYYFYMTSVGNYYAIPFVILSAYWFYEGKVALISRDQNGKYLFKINSYTLYSFAIAIFALTSSAYYGYALVIVYTMILLIYLIKFGKFDEGFYSILSFILISIVIAIVISFPTLIFWLKNGYNNIISRQPIESSMHGLSIGAMLIPISNHVLESFQNFSHQYANAYGYTQNEKNWQQIGLLASFGFCSLIILILSSMIRPKMIIENKFYGIKFSSSRYNILSFVASLNLLLILYFISEGFNGFVSFYFSIVRGIGRLNIIFIFLALLFFGLLADQLIEKIKKPKNVFYAYLFLILITALSFIDVVGSRVVDSENSQSKELYEDYKKFVTNIEESLPKGSKIFFMPVKGFPEYHGDNYSSLIGYIFSNELKLSYPAPKDRKDDLWQKDIVKLNFVDFIAEIKKHDFAGVWIQRDIFNKIHNLDIKKFENNMQKISKNKIETADKNFVFYEI